MAIFGGALMQRTRRQICLGLMSAGITSGLAKPALAQASGNPALLTNEVYTLEDGGTVHVSFDAARINRLSGGLMASFEPRLVDFGERFVSVAEQYIGKTVSADKAEISDFMTLQGLDIETFSYFCAAGLTYVAGVVYAEAYEGAFAEATTQRLSLIRKYLPEVRRYHFRPHVSVRNMVQEAEASRRFVTAAEIPEEGPARGWIALFKFGSGGFDHCGVITGYDKEAGECATIEFNTSVHTGGDNSQRISGAISRKTRPVGLIKGYIDTSRAEFPQ